MCSSRCGLFLSGIGKCIAAGRLLVRSRDPGIQNIVDQCGERGATARNHSLRRSIDDRIADRGADPDIVLSVR